ncbi:MAG TPA: hypothetical protein VFO19_21975 [Vicinamibacterales bacterium]|nr:hypothetical protein [Vicinamibacterales bacterium]
MTYAAPSGRADSKEIYLSAPPGEVVAVAFDGAGNAPTLGKAVPLFSLANALLLRSRHDGKRFLVARALDAEALAPKLTVIVSWAGAAR